MHKRDIFQEEKEIRSIISFDSICNEYLGRNYTTEIPFYSDQLTRKEDDPYFRQYDTNLMKDIPNAMLLNFNIQTLLKTVVISPNAKDYFLKPFLNLIEHYGISPDIVRPSDI